MVANQLLIASVFCLIACNSDKDGFSNGKGFHFDEKTFTSEWKTWEDQKIENYSFTLEGALPYWNFLTRDIPMHAYKVNVVVKNGVMDSFEYVGDVPHSDEDGSILEPEYTSISDMYQKIYNRAQSEKEWWNENTDQDHIISTEFVIRYNADFHIITFFEPVSQWAPDLIVDTTAHSVKISNFTVLNF